MMMMMMMMAIRSMSERKRSEYLDLRQRHEPRG
jgi:hypothetical protein